VGLLALIIQTKQKMKLRHKHFIFSLFTFLLGSSLLAQNKVEGYVFENNNRGYLQQVKITAYTLLDNIVQAEVVSNDEGYFSVNLPKGKYRLLSRKDIFFDRQDTIEVGGEKGFLKIEMRRKPGYLLDATIAESRETPDQIVDAIQGATIEIFNRTTDKPEMVLKQHPEAFFNYTFEQGNHYTALIRKPGYLAKRLEIYVNVKGCIICIDGVRSVSPGVTENLTEGNTMGTLLANIELDKAKVDKRIQIQNIYYDYDKWDIRADASEQLDKVVTLMNDNPGLKVELGSHTDSRGNDNYNQELSQRRAAAAVAYIVSEGVDSSRITAKGYGESQLANRCRNGVECSEVEHQQNRRTELRITGVSGDELEYLRWPSLEQIVRDEAQAKALKSAKNKQQKAESLPPGATLEEKH
jgi:peptidoglycan-associated lipoprotein